MASAVATLAAEIVVLILQILIMKDLIKTLINKKEIIQIIGFSFIAGLITSFIKIFLFHNIIEFFLSGTIFLISFIFLLLISKNPLIYEVAKNWKRSIKK